MKTTLPIAILSFVAIAAAEAELKLPAIVGDQMVLQQKQANPIWGWDQPGTEVKVSFGDQNNGAFSAAGSPGSHMDTVNPGQNLQGLDLGNDFCARKRHHTHFETLGIIESLLPA